MISAANIFENTKPSGLVEKEKKLKRTKKKKKEKQGSKETNKEKS